jgi:hypothetical protein
VITKRGIKKPKELLPNEEGLGVEGGQLCFREIPKVSNLAETKLFRILTDNSESLVTSNASVFTLEGRMQASAIGKDDVIETINIPEVVREQLEQIPLQTVQGDDQSVFLSPGLSYIVGTQVFTKRTLNRVYVDGVDPAHARFLAREFSETLRRAKMSFRLFLPRYGTRIRIDSSSLETLVSKLLRSEHIVPLEIRLSPLNVMRGFVCGVLDAGVKQSSRVPGLMVFKTSVTRSEHRRFILQVLRFFSIKPVQSRVHYPSDYPAHVDNFFQYADLEKLGLKFFRGPAEPEPTESRLLLSYARVVDVHKFAGPNCALGVPNPGWTLTSDLVMIPRS